MGYIRGKTNQDYRDKKYVRKKPPIRFEDMKIRESSSLYLYLHFQRENPSLSKLNGACDQLGAHYGSILKHVLVVEPFQ